jgi:salicylate hydroxylase
MMSLIGQRVTVLGAGVAGLAAARALAMRGAEVTVLEQADAIREVGAGLQVSPNAAVVLKALGLGDRLEAVSTRALAVELRDGYSGRVVTRMDVARLRPDQGYHFLHRADLIELLRQGAEEAGVTIRLLTRAASVELAGARPRMVLDTGAEEVPLLIGADGLHSVTRVALLGAEAPFFTHQVAWRALIPGDGGPNVAEVHMGEGRHLVSYPLRGGALRNIVAVEERRRWVEEGWSLSEDPIALREAFRDFDGRVRFWLDQVAEVGLWGLFRHEVARIWQKAQPDGGVAILGDAAHPTLPFLAQGASMGIEDAWVLAEELAGADSLAAGLAAYQARRIDRCRRIVAAANQNARAYHLKGVARGLAHLGLRIAGQVAPGLALSRFDWLYGHDVTREAAGRRP